MKVKFAFFTYKGYKAAVANKRDKSTKQNLAVGIRVAAAEESDAAAASVSSDGSISPLSEDQCNDGFSGSISQLSEDPCHGSFSGSISPLSEEEDSCNGGFSGDKEADITTQSRFKLASGELTYFRPELLSVVIQSNALEQSVSTRASTCSKCAQFCDSVQDPNGLIDSAAAAQCSDSNCTNPHVAARPEGIADSCDHHHPSTSADEEEALMKSEAQKRVLHELLPPSSSLHHGIVCDAPDEEEEEDRGNGSSKDVEERRKSLVSAARASNALKMKWGDLDYEDVEQMQLPGDAHDKFDNLPTNTSGQDVKQEEVHMITTADDDEEDSEENFSLKENDAMGYNSQAELALLSLLHWQDSQKLLLTANAEMSEVQGITSLLADGRDGHEFTLLHNDATAEEDERSIGLSEVRMTTELDNAKNKKGMKQPSGALKLDNEDVSGSLAALAEVAYVMAPQNQANGGAAAAAETTRRGECAMKQEDNSAENTTIYLPVSSGLCTSQAGNTSMMLEHALESEYTPKFSSAFYATNSTLAAHGFDDHLMHNAMEKKKKKGYASLVITNVKALEDGAGEDMDLCNPDEVILTSDLLETTTSSEGLRVGTAALERGDGASVKSADQEQLTDAGTITNSIKLEKCDDSRQCKGRFHQRLWFYLFENVNRAIDELYFLCELESDLNQMKEVLLILDEAGVEFKDLQMRVDAFDRITKASCLPQYPIISAPVTSSSSSSSSSISTNEQNCCCPANAWEVQRMAATSQYHANSLSSSLEALKKPQRSAPQVHRSQDRRRFDSIGFSNTEDVAAAGSELVTYHRTSSARASPQRKEAWQKKGGGCIKDEMLINNKNTTTNSVAGKRCATSSTSQIEIGFMRPTASSGQRVASREREQNLVGSKSHSMEAWKLEKRNSELAAAIIISTSDCPPPLTIAAAAQGSLESVGCSGRKRTECVCLLHDKLMSPARKKKTSPTETKNKQSEGKEAAQSVMSQLHKELHEMDRVLFLEQTTEKLSCVSKWQAV